MPSGPTSIEGQTRQPTAASPRVTVQERATVLHSLPRLYELFNQRLDPSDDPKLFPPHAGCAAKVVPNLADAVLTLRAALASTLGGPGPDNGASSLEHPTEDPKELSDDQKIDHIMRKHVDAPLHHALAHGNWRKEDGTCFPPWAAVTLYAYTLDRVKNQRVSLHAMLNELLRAVWEPSAMASGGPHADDGGLSAALAESAMHTLKQENDIGIKVGDFVRLLFKAARAALVSVDLLWPGPGAEQLLHRHIDACLGEWPLNTTRVWRTFTSTARDNEVAQARRRQTSAGAGTTATSTLIRIENPPHDDDVAPRRRGLQKMSDIAAVSAFGWEGEILFVPGLEVECARSTSTHSDGGPVKRDLDLRIVRSLDLYEALGRLLQQQQQPPPSAGGSSGGGLGSGGRPPADGDDGDDGADNNNNNNGAGHGHGGGAASSARQMARVALEAGFAEAMFTYLHAAQTDEDVADSGDTTTNTSASPMTPAVREGDRWRPASTADAMARVAVDAGFGEAMAAYHAEAMGIDRAPDSATSNDNNDTNVAVDEHHAGGRRRRHRGTARESMGAQPFDTQQSIGAIDVSQAANVASDVDRDGEMASRLSTSATEGGSSFSSPSTHPEPPSGPDRRRRRRRGGDGTTDTGEIAVYGVSNQYAD